MKNYIRSLSEAIIDWRNSGLEEFFDDVHSERLPIDTSRFTEIAADHGIEVVNYSQFLDELPSEEYKKGAPPPNVPAFATVNPVTLRPRVIINVPRVDNRLFDYIFHMLKHEQIHVQQFGRREVHPSDLWDVRDKKAYFSQKDEVMAFSHSIADQLLSMGARHVDDIIDMIKKVRLYQDIKKAVDEKTLKRYHKYIYLYLQNELNN